jgi:hypothetical protein
MATTFPRRRCRICNGWFRPNARKGNKQYACSKPECQLVRQIRNEEARLVRDPAYFRARVAKPSSGEMTRRSAARRDATENRDLRGSSRPCHAQGDNAATGDQSAAWAKGRRP